jgi:hypothetical protein
MAAKKALLTWLPAERTGLKPEPVLQALQEVGLDLSGGPWVDDLNNAAWLPLGEVLCRPENADVWVVAGSKKEFQTHSLRFGLALVSRFANPARAKRLPVVCLGVGSAPAEGDLPPGLRGGVLLSTDQADWPARVVAAAFRAEAHPAEPYRLSVHSGPGMWQWFEIGPRGEHWDGIMFGVGPEARITHHGVGPAGRVPDRAVVEYPIKGIQARVRETDYTAWSVQNRLDPETSYYVKVDGFPCSVIFGGHPGEEDAEVFRLELA